MALAAAPPSFGLRRVFLTINQQVRGSRAGRGARAQPVGAPFRQRCARASVRKMWAIASGEPWELKVTFFEKKKKAQPRERVCCKPSAGFSGFTRIFFLPFPPLCACDFFLSFFSSAPIYPPPNSSAPFAGSKASEPWKPERLQTAVAP